MKVLRIRSQATRVSAFLVYVLVIVAAVSLADRRLHNAAEAAAVVAPASCALLFAKHCARTIESGSSAWAKTMTRSRQI